VRRVAVLSDYQRVASTMTDWQPVRDRATLQFIHTPFEEADSLVAALDDVDVVCLMRERIAFPRDVLEKLPKLRCIVTTGSINRAIDMAAVRDRGVIVCGTTLGLGVLETAEMTWALILGAARHISQEDRAIRAGRWQTTIGTALHGRTLGIVGLGGVGRYVARYGQAFGMDVVAWSHNLTEAAAASGGARWVSLEELLSTSDVVTLHLVLSERTEGLIDAVALGLMQRSAILVNTSRGPIVQERALVDALQRKQIAAAALDVFDREPLPSSHPFRNLDNVTLTPHLGFVTSNVYEAFYRETRDAVVAYLDGAPIRVLDA
jgi:phosphoglycerate dehydrogenase-like enzyme